MEETKRPGCQGYAKEMFTLAREMMEVYQETLSPLAKKLGLPVAAIDILFMIVHNPEIETAGDVVKLRKYKPNLVSMHVDRLVQEGYLVRKADPKDRRRVLLEEGVNACSVVQEGERLLLSFRNSLLDGVSDELLEAYAEMLLIIRKNLKKMKRGDFR